MTAINFEDIIRRDGPEKDINELIQEDDIMEIDLDDDVDYDDYLDDDDDDFDEDEEEA